MLNDGVAYLDRELFNLPTKLLFLCRKVCGILE